MQKKRQKDRTRKHRLMVNLAEGNMKHLITKIAYLLNKYPSTRNSDITLQLKYWREFERFNIEENQTEGNHMPSYNKLIRNKIPQIIKSNGKTPTTRILNKDEYIEELCKNTRRTNRIPRSNNKRT